MKILRSVTAVALTIGAMAYFVTSPNMGANPIAATSPALGEGTRQLVESNNGFALNLFKSLRDKENGNIFFSPYSVYTAFGMVYEGARGKTEEEIRNTFQYPKDEQLRLQVVGVWIKEFNVKGPDFQLNTANSLWAQKHHAFLKTYIDSIRNHYSGHAENVDFKGDLETTRKKINGWVEDQTQQKIKDLFPDGSLDGLTRMVLVNAIHFKGQWENEFRKEATHLEVFTVGHGTQIKVPMMRRVGKEAMYKYHDEAALQVLEVPYKGDKLSMLILLPKPGGDLRKLEGDLTVAKLEEWNGKLKKQRVDLYFPKFTLNTKYSLNDTLAKLGMPSAFSDLTADFSGMDGVKNNLFIKTVVHQAFVEVNEEGTEAAAATGVALGLKSLPAPAPEFRADRPFLFLIQDRRSGAILFLGRLETP